MRRDHRDDICNVKGLLVFGCMSTVTSVGSDVCNNVTGPSHCDTCDFKGGPCVMVIEGASHQVLEVGCSCLRESHKALDSCKRL